MLTDQRTLDKLPYIRARYDALRFSLLETIPVMVCETTVQFRQEPPADLPWQPATPGTAWGGDGVTIWFAGDATLPVACTGQKVYVRARTGAKEALFLVDGEPRGVFDENHSQVLLTPAGAAGEQYRLSFEAYAGHSLPGCGIPEDNTTPFTPDSPLLHHTFDGIELLAEREDVTAFVFDLLVLLQLVTLLDEHSARRGKILAGLRQVFRVIDAQPEEMGEEHWRPRLAEARAIMRPLLDARNGDSAPWFGLVGHSHLDTAWLWTLQETTRKCARTFSSVLNLMEQYPEFRFLQSAPYHTEEIRREYPSLFTRITAKVAAGRWEPNGAMWVEPDCNIPSGESLVRQLLHGQRATRAWFGYTSDTLWLPDVFGYSAALPQLLRGCGVVNFITSKIGWNDTNRFPYDTFTWQGIDGSSVLTHFNFIHCWPDPKTLHSEWNYVQHPDVQDRRLCSFGFGDGGGGPMAEMLEVARRLENLEGVPRTNYTSVSGYMQGVRAEMPNLPTWVGELYLEGHRGTLTSIAALKRANRKIEFALRDAEYLCTLAALQGAPYPSAEFDRLWKAVLTRQFHDILPGTSIRLVNDEALAVFAQCQQTAQSLSAKALQTLSQPAESDVVLLVNTLSWERRGEVALSEIPRDLYPADAELRYQWLVDLDAQDLLLVAGLNLPALGARSLSFAPGAEIGTSPFRVTANSIETPHVRVQIDDTGRITSYIDTASQRELVVPGAAFNTFVLGEDLPVAWDNWDIDRDQRLKQQIDHRLLSQHVVADGPVQLRVRSTYAIGRESRIIQDMIFHADSPQVDFDTVIEWGDAHQLLKVVFTLDLLADQARHEIQYGHVERPTHENLSQDRARFEVCAHKWTDLSETDFGVTLFNDCKYGVSVLGKAVGLTLIKSGTHPDPRGDAGRHRVCYSLRPHGGGFSVASVIHPAYELNVAPVQLPARQADMPGLLSVDNPRVIVECVKWAEDGDAFIVRLYEASKTGSHATLTFTHPLSHIDVTNLLEEPERRLILEENRVQLYLRPFQVMTLRCVPK